MSAIGSEGRLHRGGKTVSVNFLIGGFFTDLIQA